MVIRFSSTELNNIKVSYVGKHNFSTEYIKACDVVWNELVESGKSVGKEFWNGELYTLNNLYLDETNIPVLEFGSFEYKDRLYKKNLGTTDFIANYGLNHLHSHCGACCYLITTDHKIVIGRKTTSVGLEKGILGAVGGNLNKDELEIYTFNDIFKSAIKEVEEEVNLIVNPTKFKFRQLCHFNNYYLFEFIYLLDISSQKVDSIFKPGEFIELLTFTPNELINLDTPMILDLKYSKQFLGDILNTL